MKRAIVIVIDALGVGALPDAESFGDLPECNTLGNVATACGGLRLPNLGALGLGNIIPVSGVPPVERPTASWGRMKEVSRGKDTTTGHWELAGIVLEQPFTVYPAGFPGDLVAEFVATSGCGGVLGNKPASGTAILVELDAEHQRTGHPILYTSADSVFQLAADVSVVPMEQLYSWCEVARELLNRRAVTDNVSRVIARPYESLPEGPKRLNAKRHDYAVAPPRPTVMDAVLAAGGRTVGIGKIADIFLNQGISHSVRTAGNTEGLARTCEAVAGKLDLSGARLVDDERGDLSTGEFVFTNLVDTDALYGHRNDPRGYGDALEEIDRALPDILGAAGADDLIIITGDHGCDPTMPGTDHTREHVPLLVYQPGRPGTDLGTIASFTHVADLVARWLQLPKVEGEQL